VQGERAAPPRPELGRPHARIETRAAADSYRRERLAWERVALGATPLRLAIVQAIVAAVLVVVTLAPPDPRPGFLGLSGDTNDWRSYLRLTTWTGGLGWFGRLVTHLELPPTLYVWTVRGAFAALALTQVVALLACLRQAGADGQPRAWRWLVGPVVTCLVVLVYPPVCSDVFYYAMSGHVANGGGNPYQYPLQRFVSDPLLPYQDWATITSPYGPLWTTISRGIVAITGPDPVAAVLGFKVFAVGCALGLVGVTYLLARRLTTDRRLRLGALVLTAWQPVLLYESAGGSHNDALMMLLALGGLLVLTTPRRGAVRTGLLLIAASALIKYVTLPLLAYAALWRLRALRTGTSWRRVFGQWLLDAAAAVVLAAVVFAPYWVGPSTVRSLLEQSGRLVTSTLWLVPAWEFAAAFAAVGGGGSELDRLGNAITIVAPYVILPLIGLLVIATLRRLWPAMRAVGPHAPAPPPVAPGLAAQVDAWAVTTVVLAFIPMNTHSWYAIWTVAPVALAWVGRSQAASPAPGPDAGEPLHGRGHDSPLPLPRWLVLFCAWLLINTLVYHTHVIS